MKPIYLFRSALISAIFVAGSASAQLDSCNVFLQGNYVEVGISPSGSYGSSSGQPAGYHGNSAAGTVYNPCGSAAGNRLGFVADPAMDGWSVGTPPFFGDYFLPGAPFEGWSIQVGTTARADAWNTITTGFTGGITGANTSYLNTGGTISGTWEGTYDSMTIKQVTTIDTASLFFTTTVTLTNLSSAAINDIYYLRSVDPDNDEMEPGGGFPTNNKIEYQLPDSLNATVVSATAVLPADSLAYLALGTNDTTAKCFIYVHWPIPSGANIYDMYGETVPGTYGDYYYTGSYPDEDISIGLSIKVAHLAAVDSAVDSVLRTTSGSGLLHPANSESFTFFYAFSKKAVDSALKATAYTATTGALAINNVNTVAGINVYPNPSKDIINVTGLNNTDHLSLYDMMGRQVNQNWVVSGNGTNTFHYSNIPPGAYILVVTDADGNVRARTPVRKM